MDKKLPGSRFRIFLAVLGVCVATGIALSYFEQGTVAGPRGESGTLEKMVVANGNAVLDLDLGRLNGGTSSRKTTPITFTTGSEAFFPVQIFNSEFRSALQGTMNLVPQGEAVLPATLQASYHQLVVERMPWGSDHDLVIRDGRTGFVFFNIEGERYEYNADAHTLQIADGRAVVSNDFAAALGRPSSAGTPVGTLLVNASMRVAEVAHINDGDVTSEVLPAGDGTDAGTVPGPDVIVGDVYGLAQFGSSAGTQVGLAVGTASCNIGTENLDWFALPDNDHPVIPQNMYRMSGGANGTDRFEQIGQSAVKHAFTALTQNICSLGCNGTGGTHLGSGCSDPYDASLNAGPNLGSRAWVNPFTGAYPRGDSANNPNSHSGHTHLGPSHRVLVEMNDLNTSMNAGASYFAEGQYVTPHEYVWCQAHPGQCNMNNNVSYRKYTVSGTTSPFSFSAPASTVRQQPAINAWTGATLVKIEPSPGNDGIGWIAYKVTSVGGGIYHYEYAIYNQNLDRGIQSITIPIVSGVGVTNVGFHEPPQQPGWSFDGTTGNLGYSSTAWAQTQLAGATMWSSESFAQNPNANAVRWGSMYNVRFDADRPPEGVLATVGYFKTGDSSNVIILGPAASTAPPPCNTRVRPLFPNPSCGPGR